MPFPALPDPPDDGSRLTISTRAAARDHLHGAWWPASTDLVRELEPMLRAASAFVPEIVGVSLNRDEWPDAPLRFRALPTRSPVIAWYGLTEAHLAVLRCAGHRKYSLLVVPPHTPVAVARTAMSLASEPGNSSDAPSALSEAALRVRQGAGQPEK